jgi:SAM-dependent methyltransferase
LKIVSDAANAQHRVQGSCTIDLIEQAGTTLLHYQADVHINGVPQAVADRLAEFATKAILRRAAALWHGDAEVAGGEVAESNLSRAAQAWDEFDFDLGRRVAWSAIEFVSRAYGRDFSGSVPSTLYVHQLLAERLSNHTTDLKGAALVCGDMIGERPYFETDEVVTFSEVDGFDISSVSLARYQPDRLTFHPHLTDCNDIVLEPQKYELVVACHGAHHVYNLGNLFYQARKSLKDGGLLFMAEWIGPEYLQIPRANRIIAKLLLLLLFSRKTRTTHMGQVKGLRWIQPLPEAFDPSEACNSTELMPQFLKYFNPIRKVYFAGLSYPIFEGIAQNIDQAKRINRAKIKLVYCLERWLTRLGIVKPLFVMAVGEKRPGIF